VLAGLILVAAVVGGGAYLASHRSRSPTVASPSGTVGPETERALARVRELEARVAELEREKAALEAALGPGRPVPRAGGVADLDDPGVVAPTLLREETPVRYPPDAAGRERPARVVVEALVGEDGRVLEARALESSVVGMGLEEAAERHVTGRVYRPATRGGTPVRARIRVPVEFTPQNPRPQ
jgi:TonB family protein